MPIVLHHSAMITSPSGQGVIVIGGDRGYHDYSDAIFELYGNDYQSLKWRTLPKKLKFPRRGHLALFLPEKENGEV